MSILLTLCKVLGESKLYKSIFICCGRKIDGGVHTKKVFLLQVIFADTVYPLESTWLFISNLDVLGLDFISN